MGKSDAAQGPTQAGFKSCHSGVATISSIVRLGRCLAFNPGENLFSPQELARVGAFLELTDRELEVLTLLIDGHTHQGIANRMDKGEGQHIRPTTARTYLDRIYRKARVENSLALVLRLVRIHRFLNTPSPSPSGTGPG